jgi:single-strand DNA-binding protein
MLNRIILMGRLVADPELRQTPNGISVATFRIAVDRNYQSKGSGERQADFISCVAWRQTGEFISRYFQKGRMIAVEGSLQTRNYEDKTGAKRTAYEVVVDQAYFADSRQGGGNQAEHSYGGYAAAPAPQAAAPRFEEPQRGQSLSVGSFGGFEELDTDDGDLPF